MNFREFSPVFEDDFRGRDFLVGFPEIVGVRVCRGFSNRDFC